MKNTSLYTLLFLALASCSSAPEATAQEQLFEQADTIQKIAGYDISHLGLVADDFDLPYQKISGRMLLWIAAEYCDTALFSQLRYQQRPH